MPDGWAGRAAEDFTSTASETHQQRRPLPVDGGWLRAFRLRVQGMAAGLQLPGGGLGAGGVGGFDHGTLVKSKKSIRSGWAASRLVRWADEPMKRFSTNLMTAV